MQKVLQMHCNCSAWVVCVEAEASPCRSAHAHSIVTAGTVETVYTVCMYLAHHELDSVINIINIINIIVITTIIIIVIIIYDDPYYYYLLILLILLLLLLLLHRVGGKTRAQMPLPVSSLLQLSELVVPWYSRVSSTD